MADEEQVRILKREVGAWNTWKAENPDVRPDFRGVNLRGADLRGADLTRAHFDDADLRSARLDDARLIHANLIRANLVSVNLLRANLLRANLTGAQLTGAQLIDTNLTDADLTRANLTDADLTRAQLDGADLHHADLHQANLRYTNFINARLDDARLINADFSGANLTGANLGGAMWGKSQLADVAIGDVISVARNKSIHQAPWSRVQLESTFTPFDDDNPLWITRSGDEPIIDRVTALFQGLSGQPSIVRSLEFPPEYHEAGKSILSYFSTILRDKYPDTEVGVTISQKGNTVTMAIETPEGEREEIERTLGQYALVVVGQIPIEEFAPDPIQAVELRSQLRHVQALLETKNEILKLKDQMLENQRLDMAVLQQLVSKIALKPTAPIVINNSTAASASLHQDFHLGPQLEDLRVQLNALIQELPAEDRAGIEEIAGDLEDGDAQTSPEQARSSLSRLDRKLQELGDEKTPLGKRAKGFKKAIETAKGLGPLVSSILQQLG